MLTEGDVRQRQLLERHCLQLRVPKPLRDGDRPSCALGGFGGPTEREVRGDDVVGEDRGVALVADLRGGERSLGIVLDCSLDLEPRGEDHPEVVQGVAEAVAVARPAGKRDGLLHQRLQARGIAVAEQKSKSGGYRECLGRDRVVADPAGDRVGVLAFRDRLVDASQPVIEESPRPAGLRTQAIVAHTRIEEQLDDRRPRAARVEELERREHEPGPVVDPPPRAALGDPRHQVLALSLQRLEPLQLVAVDPVLVHLADHTSKPLQERLEDRVALARGRGQLPLRVLADRLQHPVAVTAPLVDTVAHKAPVEQRLDQVDACARHTLGSIPRAAPHEHTERTERTPLVSVEQLVRPRDRRIQRALTLVDIVVARRKEIEPLLEPREDHPRRHRPRAGRRKLDRKRQIVEPATQRSHRLVTDDIHPDRPRALDEQPLAVARRQRRHRPRDLRAHPHTLTTRDQQPQRGAGRDQRSHVTCGRRQKMLDVVEQQQRSLADQGLGDGVGKRPLGLLAQLERLRDSGDHERRVTNRRERNPDNTVRIAVRGLGRGLQRQPRLAGAPRAGEREHPDIGVGETLDDLGELVRAATKRCRRDRQVRPIQRPERRKRRQPARRPAAGTARAAPRDPSADAPQAPRARTSPAPKAPPSTATTPPGRRAPRS